ncbi:n-acetylmuramoyl-L-alanine amidase domain-containing protein [Phthorimaea operculella]|nr:n-acetylmuramoyl-L-alanine amidase domain-containing protein [Phthorimaea operculella]
MFASITFCALAILITHPAFTRCDCGVVTRKEWDGVPPVRVEYLARPVDLVIIQHTATPTCTTDAACAERVRNIQDYHMDQLNYPDIGYNFLIGSNGKVYEGKGWLHAGAHTYGYNKKSIAITFIGNFNVDTPTEASLEAAKSLIQCGVDRGHLKRDYHLVGHRQLVAIQSPGRKLYAEIRSWPNWLEDTTSIKV